MERILGHRRTPLWIAAAALVIIGLGLAAGRDKLASRMLEFSPRVEVQPVTPLPGIMIPVLKLRASEAAPLDPVALAVSRYAKPVSLVIAGGAALASVILVPGASLAVLTVAATLDRYRFDIVSFGLRIEHLALLLVGLAWLVRARRGRREQKGPLLGVDDALLGLYLAIAFAASFLNAPSFKESLKFLGLMGLACAMYWLVKRLLPDRPAWERAFTLLVGIGIAEAVFGILSWLVFPTGLNLGVELYLVGPAMEDVLRFCTFSPTGTLFEPNIFGSYTMATSLVLGTLFLDPRYREKRKWLGAALVICLVAVGLSLTRGAWLAVVAGLGLMVLLAQERRPAMIGSAAALGVLVIAATLNANLLAPCRLRVGRSAIGVISPAALAPDWAALHTEEGKAAEAFLEASSPSGILGSSTPTRILGASSVNYRLDTYVRALRDWTRQPWIGNGANVFAQRYSTTSYTPDWISNVVLQALHDTGIIGLLVLLACFAFLGWEALRAIEAAPAGRMRTAMRALLISFAGLLVAYQVTTAFWLGFTWIYLGLIRTGTLLLQRESAGARVRTPAAAMGVMEIPASERRPATAPANSE